MVMKITLIKIKKPEPVKLEDFAESNGLELVVEEMPWGVLNCTFKGAEVKDGAFLMSVYGYAKDIFNSIRDYCFKIEGQLLIVDAYKTNRREIQVPAKLIPPTSIEHD